MINLDNQRTEQTAISIGVLKTITELSQDRLDVLFGAYALLDRTEEALTCLKKLPESTQKEIYFVEGKSIQ